MKKLIKILCLLILIPLSARGQVVDSLVVDSLLTDSLAVDTVLPWPLYMTTRLDSAIAQNPVMRFASLGMQIYDYTADSILYNVNESKLMTPASNEKILTSITALEHLGKDYIFNTKLCITGKISADSVGSRDSLLYNGLDSVPFHEVVYKRVWHGDIYAIGSFDPMFEGYDLQTFVNVLTELGIDSIHGSLYEDVSLKDSLLLGKGWSWDDGDSNPVLSPLLLNRKAKFMQTFLSELNKQNITVSGGIGTAICPPEAIVLAEKQRTLLQLLPRLMKNSDNLYAEAVFYQLAALSHKKYATADDANHIITKMIKKLGFDDANFRIVDGSGLSHYNKLSAELIVAFYKYARNNPVIYETLYPNLAIAGVDGTIEKHMTEGPAFKNVHAKTGTLSGVIGLSGYCTAANGHELIFSMLFNGVRNANAVRDFEDDLCTIMAWDDTPLKIKKKPTPQRRVVRRRAPVRKK